MPIDCLPKNILPKTISNNTGIIINLDDLGGNGTHWVAVIRKNNKCLYYDSMGIIYMPKEIEKLLINSVGENNVYISNEQNQYVTNLICGYYCLKKCKNILYDGMTFKQSSDMFTDMPSKKNIDLSDDLFI